MGLLEALTLIFVVLKLMSIIDWSWWVVISPMYGAVVIWLLVFFGMLALYKKRYF